jgi:hypothetical protein
VHQKSTHGRSLGRKNTTRGKEFKIFGKQGAFFSKEKNGTIYVGTAYTANCNRGEQLNAKKGCQIFLAKTYQNVKNIPNNHALNQTATKYTQWP